MSGCESGSNNSTDEGGKASFAAKIRFIVIRRRLPLRGGTGIVGSGSDLNAEVVCSPAPPPS